MSVARRGDTQEGAYFQSPVRAQHRTLTATPQDGRQGAEAAKLPRTAIAQKVFRRHCAARKKKAGAVLECGVLTPLSFDAARLPKKAAMNRRTPEAQSRPRNSRM